MVGGCLLTHFNFIVQNNALYGYPASTGVWGGAGILVADLRTFPSSGSTMPTNACVFDCIVEGGGGGGLAVQPQAQSGGNNFITGTYEGFTTAPVSGSLLGTGYALHIDGCSGFDLYDLHVEADTEGTLIRNSSGFTVRQSGFYSWVNSSNQSVLERLRIEASSSFRVERITVGLLQIEPTCSQYQVDGVVGSKDVYAVARKQDSLYIGGPDPVQGGIAWGAGMAAFTTENLVPNGDLSRTPHGFTYAGVVPSLVRTGEGQADPTRRFNRYGLKVSGGAASGFSTRATLIVPVPDSLRYLGQPVTIWADIKRISGPDLYFGVNESVPGRFRTLQVVPQNESEWVRVAATHYPSTTNGAWAIFISPADNQAYSYHLGAVGAVVGVAAPMGVGSPVPSFQDGLQLTGKRMEYASAAPTTGTWQPGDIVFNATAAAGGFVGWVCTAAGTPGTWKTFGAISA